MTGAGSEAIAGGRAVLGVEFGSTRLKACLVGDDPSEVLAVGSHAWENSFVDRRWTYSLDEVHAGLQAAYADLARNVRERHGVALESLAGIGVSAMMHGYLAFDDADELLVPFRTWRNTNTAPAAGLLTELFGVNIPLRWSAAHFAQAVLDDEPHVDRVSHLTTLAGYVHWKLTGRQVLGVGDASGMFPIDAATGRYDDGLLDRFDERFAGHSLRPLLPEVLAAGEPAGRLSDAGAALLDPTGTLRAGALACPPEGDAGTGMVATNCVAPRTGNVSAGTSIFAMVVLERPLQNVHPELDLVSTPSGDPVAMVHCNNGASELDAFAGMFARFAEAAGNPMRPDEVFDVLLREAAAGLPDAGGVLSYNQLSGEPVLGLDEGRPMLVRGPGARLTLADVMRSQVYGVFAALAIGMRTLDEEDVAIDRLFGHGGLFRTAGVAQGFLSGALGVPVAVGASASEGGAWGIAVLAAFALAAERDESSATLAAYLTERVFDDAEVTVVTPDPADVEGFAAYLELYRSGLVAERAAVESI